MLVVACLGLAPLAGASPIPPDPELWVMDADGTGQRVLIGQGGPFDGYTDFSWSPDSTRVVTGGLVVVDVASGDTTDLGSGGDVDWSPVSDEIVFTDTSATGAHTSVYVVESDGSDRRLLVDLPAAASHPAWSPDGQRVAFVGGVGDGQGATVYVVDRDGTDLRVVGGNSLYTAPRWSPDGQRIGYVAFDYMVHLARADGSGEQVVGGFQYSSEPAWCPDGTLYVVGQREGDEEPALYRVTSDGHASFVTPGGGPDCSPTGTVAYPYLGDLHLLDPCQSGEPNLTDTDDRSEFRPRWSPDGARIAFVSLPDLPDPVIVERTITLKLDGHLTLKGRVEPRDTAGCWSLVKLQRMTTDGWKSVTKVSSPASTYREEVKDRPGYYRAVLRESHSEFGEYRCLRAVSDVVRHRHRPNTSS